MAATPSLPSAPPVRRWHSRWRHSIRWRLVTLFLLLAMGISVVFVFGMQRMLSLGWQAYAKPLLTDYVDKLAQEIGSPPDPDKARAIVARLPVAVHIDGPLVRYSSHPLPRWHDVEDERRWGLSRSTADGHRLRFGLAEPAELLHRPKLGWWLLAGLLSLTALAYLAVHRLLSPLKDIGAGAERFGRGEFHQVIPVRRQDELGLLAGGINAMAGNLHGMLDAKRALLLAISHELRSPLTRARLNTELLADSAERSALLRDLGVMRDLVTDLLEGERLSAGHTALQREPTDLAALVRELVEAQFADRGLQLALADGLARQAVDPARLRLLLRNLVDNALRHAAGAPRPPEVFLRRTPDGQLALGVRDWGPGVSAAQRARLTEAFYRPDSARTREAGGVGLGLHLCRLVAQAHGGTLTLNDARPGLEVSFTWTAVPTPPQPTTPRP